MLKSPLLFALPLNSLPAITSNIFAFFSAFPVILVSVFLTSFIVILPNLVFPTSTIIPLLSFFPSSFCTTFIFVPLCCFGICILYSPFSLTIPVYFVPLISTIILLAFIPVPVILTR